VAHELGHAFDLNNDFRDEKYIMSYRAGNQGQLSACAAGFLAVHPYFNADIGIGPDESSSTIHLVSPPGYAPGSQSIPVRVRIVNSAGLHQVLFVVTTQLPHFEAGHAEVKTCRSFSGERSAVVEFDYDGLIPSNGLTSLANPIVHRVRSWAFDTSGRFSALGFSLYQISDRHIDTLDKPGVVTSLAFSPSSTALAAGYSLVKFWDLRTRQIIASFEPESPAWAVAISPDGATLASEHNGTVTLWDLASRTDYAELVGQPGDSRFSSVAFSPPDGATLAALSGNSTVKLWNLETRANYADLDHDSDVTTMAFSPDRERLASGLNDGVIHIWDPATGKHLAAWKGHRGWVGAVAFSPQDGASLATKAGWDGLVKFWDVRTQRHVATRENIRGGSSMAFSPDGTVLACASGEVVKLWHVPTRTQIDALAHRGIVRVVAFSPNGKMLASGTRRRLELWDASEWLRPRPYALAIVSGDGQRDKPGTLLTGPFVVEVRDQNGNVLEGAQVTFTVARSSGTLTTATAATDSLVRAAATLYLGAVPGLNTVLAEVQGLDAVLFIATAIAPPDFDADGEVGFGDFVLFAGAFGGSDRRFDLNSSGSVDFADFILFAKFFGQPARTT
jgi:WD40 repeat protein